MVLYRRYNSSFDHGRFAYDNLADLSLANCKLEMLRKLKNTIV